MDHGTKTSYIDDQKPRLGWIDKFKMRLGLGRREESQDEASAEVKRYFPRANTSKFLTKMDEEHGQGVMVKPKKGKNWLPLTVNGELNKRIPAKWG